MFNLFKRQKNKQELKVINEISDDKKPYANMSTIISFFESAEAINQTFVMNNSDVEIEMKGETEQDSDVIVSIFSDFSKAKLTNNKKYFSIVYDSTNDAFVKMAGSIVGLGYHMLRVGLKNAQILQSDEMLKFSGKSNDLTVTLLRPQRWHKWE